MTMKFTRAAALGGGLAVLLTPFVAPMASAIKDATKVVINEVYTFGGTKAGVYPDFVELYNPSDQQISLEGMTLYPAAGNGALKDIVKLKGTIGPKGYYLVAAKPDATHQSQKLPHDVVADQVVQNMNFPNDNGIVVLAAPGKTLTKADLVGDLTGKYIDAVGIGTKAKAFEGTQAKAGRAKSSGDERSYQRTPEGADTDNNSNDFSFRNATPKASGKATDSNPPATENPDTTIETPGISENLEGAGSTAPTKELKISEIQGTGKTSDYVDHQVTTTGVVTATYPDGGFRGAYIQTEGSGGANHGKASHGIFVFSDKIAHVEVGKLVTVTGKVTEWPREVRKKPADPAVQMTEINASNFTVSDRTDVVQPVPVELEKVPDSVVEREALEGMLVKITGKYTVTDNYSTAQYGQIGLAPGDKPFFQPTELYSENDERAQALDNKNKAELITLDDGASWQTDVKYYKARGKSKEVFDVPKIPASYLDVNKPIRVGAHVTFKDPMILDFRNQWNLQPRFPVQEKSGDNFKDRSWDVIELTNYERPKAPKIDGDVTISSFNVLNYFTDLGENEEGCTGYPDIKHEGIATDHCEHVRGAYSQEAFKRQQTKIVEAITELDSTVVGLEEIENSARFGQNRDAALKTLTDALNAKAHSEKWKFVPSPTEVGKNEDVIRLAYIYQPAKVTPIGDSVILRENSWFDTWARQPLAQKWSPVVNGKKVGKQFVSVVNHFKSKGSVASSKKKGSKVPLITGDNKTLAGNNNLLRVNQANEMTTWVKEKFAGEPVIILGDLNSYSKESPVQAIKDAGYTSVAEHAKIKNMSYQFKGVIGSLDHALVNKSLLGHVTTADVWNVNALEPVAFEYARYRTTINDPVKTFDLSAYRSSDHDPIKVGLKLIDDKDKPAPGETPSQPADPTDPAPGETPSQPDEPSAPSEEPSQPTPPADTPSTPPAEKPADPSDKPADPSEKPADPSDKPSTPSEKETTPWTELTPSTNVGPVFANSDEIEKALTEGKAKITDEYTVVRGESVDVALEGLKANTEARVYFYSDPVLLVKKMADAAGKVSVNVPTTKDTELGAHYVVAASTVPGDQATALVKVTVLPNISKDPDKGAQDPTPEQSQAPTPEQSQAPSQDPTPEQSQTPSPEPTQKAPTTKSQSTSAPKHKGGLALTGASVAGLGVVALTVLLAGATMVIRRREN
ncbi:ExeM/NucH family extracellular endonuclease [Arcanobacterium canis]